MFISHLPAGYLLSKAILARKKAKGYGLFLWLGLVASVLPDLDMLYFYFVDKRQHLHHSYWPHIPAFWLAMFLAAIILWGFIRNAKYRLASMVFFLNVFMHLFLDTICGGILWGYPFIGKSFVFFEVPARFNWWVLSFITHWTFGLEILLLVAAVVVIMRLDRGKSETAALLKNVQESVFQVDTYGPQKLLLQRKNCQAGKL